MIEAFIAALAQRLDVPRRSRLRILAEVRDHLDDAAASLQRQGTEPAAAREQAVKAFGSADALAEQWNAQAATTAMRRTPVIVALSGALLVCGFLVAALSQPRPKSPANAELITQVSFFAAVLGLQVALVAGARAAALVAARWRSSLAPESDHRVVARCSLVAVGGLSVAALGWIVTLLTAVDRLAQARTNMAVLGIVVMVGAVASAAVGVRRRSVHDQAGLRVPDTDPERGLLGLGEAMVGVIQRSPVIACSALALIAAVAAMSHAESTLLGALPWGGSEVVAVIAGYLLLGPHLGLRSPRRLFQG